MTKIGDSLDEALNLLRNDEIIAIPTETVYGLAGNAYKPEVVIKIFEIKNRPTFNPLIVHTHSIESSLDFVEKWDKRLLKLAEHYSPGAITFLLPKKDIIPDLVTAGSSRVAVRIPNHSVTLKLLKNLDFPLAAPSANPFGYVSPTSSEHVFQSLNHKIPMILEGGKCSIGIESTIVGIENNELVIYRLGGISQENIEELVGKVSKIHTSSSKPETPGMLIQHYAPKKKLILTNSLPKYVELHNKDRMGIIFFGKPFNKNYPFSNLSESRCLQEAAKNLFQILREIESWEVDYVVMEWIEEKGLGRAVNDRLKRAASSIINF